ncbi:MAG: agmatinase [Oscillospiraceae bacterium]|jgi:agmatinase|nr:agmatinase [Oscillospiraceae bacterium]
MWSNSGSAFIGCDASYEEAAAVLFGAPFDGTTSFRPGARFGPHAIRSDAFGIETYSPYQNRDLTELRLHDVGDLELPFGNADAALSAIEVHTRKLLGDGKTPVLLGGEHLVTLGALRAVHAAHPGLHVVQFDAHADLRDDYLGEKLSHACVMRRAWELLGDGAVHQFGIRSGEQAEFAFAAAHTELHPFAFDGLSDTVRALGDTPVYFTLDLDVLDPSAFPGTGTPEPGGVAFRELLQAVLALGPLNIVAFDLTELSPPYDPTGASTAAACKILRELLLLTIRK